MPGLPELPIRVEPDTRQTETKVQDDADRWQTFRGPKPKPASKGTVPLGWMRTEEETP